MEKQEFSIQKFSNVAGSTGEAELKMLLESIDIPLRGLTVVRPVHSTVLARSHCFQITTPSETRYFTCNSEEDANNWVAGLKDIIYPNRDKERRVDTSLDVWIFEAKGLPSKKRYYCEIVLDKVLYGRTSTKLKSDILFWGEQFSFDDLPSIGSLSLYVFKENESKKKRKERNVFIGAVEVPLDSIQANSEVETWLSLRPPGVSPRPQPKNASNRNEQLSVRVKIKYQTISILPIVMYKDLHEYIKMNYLLLCKELEGIVSLRAKDELAQTLLKILQAANQAKEFLADIIIAEVNALENENLTFRGNTLATKSMDTYMKMIGTKYLHRTLARFVKSLYHLEEDFEVDPVKLSTGNLIENQKNLLKLVEEAWSYILTSYHIFPSDLQQTLSLIKRRCEALQKDVSVKLISGSVFLRFLCPAILSPSLFHLTREYPNEKTARCLTLIAKALQNLANFTRFGGKESYMQGLNEFVERELSNMKNFLDLISSEPDEQSGQYAFDGYIDIGRELAVMAKLLTENFQKLSEDSRRKLDPLNTILTMIQDSFVLADKKANAMKDHSDINRLNFIARSNSLPKNTGALRSATAGNKPDLFQSSCYTDAVLSSAQDYVSGCSLIMNTPLKPKGSIAQRTKGRASDMRHQYSNTNQSAKVQENAAMFSRAERKYLGTSEESNFLRSSSFHGRSSRDEKQSMLTSHRSFDTDKSSDFRHGLTTAKSDSRLRSKSDQSSRVESTDDLDNSRSFADKSHVNSSMSLNSIFDTTKQTNAHGGDKTIRRLPDIIHESVTWSDITDQPNQPLYFSPATEPMTPLGNRQFKFGFDSLTHSEKDNDNDNNLQSKFDVSLDRLSGVQKHSGSSRSLNEQPKVELKRHAALPMSCNNLSGQSSDSDSFFRLNNNRENVNSPSCALSASQNEDHSSARSIASNAVLCDSCQLQPSLAAIRTTRRETGSTCSLNTCSCTSSEDLEGVEHRHTHHQNGNIDVASSTFEGYSGSPEKSKEETSAIATLTQTNETVRSGMSTHELERETSELRHQLRLAQMKLRTEENGFMKRAKAFEECLAAGKRRLEETETKLRRQKKDKEEQMKSIISRLLNVESDLRKEQTEMQEIVQAKQKIIEMQEKRIRALDAANKRLVSALTQLRTKHDVKNNDASQNSIEGQHKEGAGRHDGGYEQV